MKKTIIIGLSLIVCIFAQAQEPAQYIHFNMGGGAHNLSYNMPNGTQVGKAGFTLNGAYSYFFTPNWGVQAGLGIQSFGATSKLNYFTTAPVVDAEGDAFEFRTQYTNWQEKQNALFIEIPLAAQYRYAINEKFGLIGSLGAKISFPVYAKYKTFAGQIRTTGYYDQWNVELSDLPEEGYKTYTNSFSDKLSLKPAFMGLVDLGGLYRLTHNMELYVGGYLNYGLNRVNKPDTKLILQRDGVYNGIFASNQVTAVKPISFGLKVGIYWQLTKKQATAGVAELIQPIAEIINEKPKDTIVIQEVKPLIAEIKKDTIVPIAPAEVKIPIQTIAQKELVQVVDSFEIIKKLVELTDFHFGLNSALPTAMEIDIMKIVSRYLKSNPNAQLYAVGHTCNIGSHASNYQIGLDRAIMVKRAFIKLGSPAKQVIAVSKSYDMPLVPNTTAANRAKNRRVEFRLVKK